jgi:hypothetical protein
VTEIRRTPGGGMEVMDGGQWTHVPRPAADALDALERDIETWRKTESDLGAAYLRLRNMIPGALDTPFAPSAETVWATTEHTLNKHVHLVENLQAALTDLLDALEEGSRQWNPNSPVGKSIRRARELIQP